MHFTQDEEVFYTQYFNDIFHRKRRNESKTIRFGRQIFWEDQYLRGALDEAYLFDAALSGDQIRSLMRGEVDLPGTN